LRLIIKLLKHLFLQLPWIFIIAWLDINRWQPLVIDRQKRGASVPVLSMCAGFAGQAVLSFSHPFIMDRFFQSRLPWAGL